MNKLCKALLARCIESTTQREIDTLCHDVDIWFQKEKITWEEHELFFRLINKLHPYDGEKYKA